MARLDWRGRQAMLRLARAHGGTLELEDLERLVFGPWRADYARRSETGREASWDPHLSRLRHATGASVADLPLLTAWFRPYGEQLEPLPGVAEALEELRSGGLGLALVSNVPLPGALYLEVLKLYDLERWFHRCFFSYDCQTRKPSPAMVRLALQELAVEPAAAVMVGDRRDRDVAAGRAAGTATIWVKSDDGGGPCADAVVASLAEVPARIRGWQGSGSAVGS